MVYGVYYMIMVHVWVTPCSRQISLIIVILHFLSSVIDFRLRNYRRYFRHCVALPFGRIVARVQLRPFKLYIIHLVESSLPSFGLNHLYDAVGKCGYFHLHNLSLFQVPTFECPIFSGKLLSFLTRRCRSVHSSNTGGKRGRTTKKCIPVGEDCLKIL